MKNTLMRRAFRNIAWSLALGFLVTFLISIIFMTEVLEGHNRVFDLKDSFFIKTYFASALCAFLSRIFLVKQT